MTTAQRIKNRVLDGKIVWRGHALMRMIERDISREEVKSALIGGKIIESYEEDFPFPSFLVLGFVFKRPLHIVCALADDTISIITAYQPDSSRWSDDYQKRRH